MNVLIVDDLFVNRMLLSEIIEQLGYSYKEVVNGKEAIDELKVAAYDFVLMDVEMPVMNGIEATKYIKNPVNGLSRIIVLGVTAHDPEMFFEDYDEVGFDGLITKPYTLEKIKNALDKQLNKL